MRGGSTPPGATSKEALPRSSFVQKWRTAVRWIGDDLGKEWVKTGSIVAGTTVTADLGVGTESG